MALRLKPAALEGLPTAIANGGTGAASAAGARAQLGVAGKASARNRHLNPGMQVCQDRALGATVALSTSGYIMDGVAFGISGSGVLTGAQVIKATPGGAPTRVRVTVTTPDTAIAAGDAYGYDLRIEGSDVADLCFGTPLAKGFVWRGVVNFPAGAYCISFKNASSTRSFVATFSISATEANADKLITVTVPGCTDGVWIADASGVGMMVSIMIACGTTYQTSTLGAWVSGNYVAAATQSNGMVSTASVFEVADVGLYSGSDLPDWELPSYDGELRRCQRYYGQTYIYLWVQTPMEWTRGYFEYTAPPRVSPALTAGTVIESSHVGTLIVQSGLTGIVVAMAADAGGNGAYAGIYIYNCRL